MSKTITSEVIWQPSGKYLESRVAGFMRQHGINDWRELIAKSNADTEWFWKNCMEYMGVQWHKPYTRVMNSDRGFPWTTWFEGGEMNIAANILDFHMEAGKKAGDRVSVGKDHPAMIWEGEDGRSRKLTYGELNKLSGQVAQCLLKLNVKAGDAVGIYMPMIPEVVAVLFGCLKIGAVAVPVFSGYGPHPLAARLNDAKARVLFTADAGKRSGKLINIKAEADEAMLHAPCVEHMIVVKHCSNGASMTDGRDMWFHDVVLNQEPAPTVANLPSEHPSMYLYTSGTTGKPKGTVHTHAGALAQIAKELGFAFDCQSSDVFFWVTDIGWMMGPWEMIGTMFWGATMVVYEGHPGYPEPDAVWKIVNRHNVTTLGISPTLIRMLKSKGDEWVDKHDLTGLRLLGSTGEPWDHDTYMWFFEKVGGKRCPIINISGGTEVVGCLLSPLPVMPLKPCSLGGPGLGMAIDVYNEEGKSISGEIGHLVCKKPGPSMTRGFLGDPDRYIDTYFSKFPGIWYHGDWAKVDEDGSWFLFGRSDDTIKVAGKRVGPGEVESVLVEHSDVAEAAVIGVPHPVKGETLICFVVLMPNAEFSTELERELRDMIGARLGSTLKPEEIHCVKVLPKTRSGKIVRGVIRKKYLGETGMDLTSVENPEALDYVMSKQKA
ncbi:MAG: AMP-binding protein [Cyanobacteria bacterium SZAS LIN-3]|nr:AMP-binding protein [Cyanobacteria bacterium SZAS LIN-3]MBS2007225.1 AMP-binding protein [Cyanobacteria bacterium SZAS TMP-1]